MRFQRIAALGLALAPVQCTAQSAGGVPAASAAEAAATITAEDLRRRIGVIAHDSMAGRDTPSAELDATAAWIADELARMGLRGGAPGGGFIQRYPLRTLALDPDASSLRLGDRTLRYGPDVLPLRAVSETVVAAGEVVVVSGSSELAGAAADAVRGRHVAVVPGVGLDRRLFRMIGQLVGAGAASVWVASPLDAPSWEIEQGRLFRTSITRGWSDEPEGPAPPGVPVLQIRAAALQGLLADHGVDVGALRARSERGTRVDPVPGLSATLTHTMRVGEVTAPNVVGVLDGADPRLRAEHVVFSAHMDHIGVGAPDEAGDSIFNGADDDASGTAAVMEVAEAMALLPTRSRRSLLFLFVSGEEKGLWGSAWYAEHPTVPLDRLVANVNLDMVGRNWPDTIVAIGKEHSDLGSTLEAVGARHPELGMTAIDDPWPDERFYFRSDHFNFAQRGVPVLFLFNGTHDDYHGRDDEPERIDAEKAARIARLVFHLGLEVAEATERPRWNPESYARIVTGR